MATPTTPFQVHGMTCGHCERAVTQAVLQVDPDAQVRIDRASGKVDVDSTASREALPPPLPKKATASRPERRATTHPARATP